MQAVHTQLYRYLKLRSNVSLSFAYEESGLDYAMNRFYGNSNGRFNSPDPGSSKFEFPQTLHRLTYSINDPINGVDPDAKFPRGIFGPLPFMPFCDPRFPSGVPGFKGVDFSYNCFAVVDVMALAVQEIIQSRAEVSCEDRETAWLENYFATPSRSGSPLRNYARTIVEESNAAGVDYRFIVALAGKESSYGTRLNAAWGPFNAWNVSTHMANNPYSSWEEAIQDVIRLITGRGYFGANPPINATDAIYQKYVGIGIATQGDIDVLNQIYLGQMDRGTPASVHPGGDRKRVDFARCPPGS